jgi:hypothetical protein
MKVIRVFIFNGKSYSNTEYNKLKDKPVRLPNSEIHSSIEEHFKNELPKNKSLQIITNVDTGSITIRPLL